MTPPPETTALGGIRTHLMRRKASATSRRTSPGRTCRRCPISAEEADRYEAMAERALRDLDAWLAAMGLASSSSLAR